MSWGLGLLDSANSGKTIAWVGMSMFAALAVGAPVGTVIFAAFGFAGIALATGILPLAALLMILPMRGTDIRATGKPRVRKVLGAVLMPGFGFALSGITFGAMTAVCRARLGIGSARLHELCDRLDCRAHCVRPSARPVRRGQGGYPVPCYSGARSGPHLVCALGTACLCRRCRQRARLRTRLPGPWPRGRLQHAA
jgi:hypothetical protein